MDLFNGYKIGYFFVFVPDSNLASLLEHALNFYAPFPVIAEAIESDLQASGKSTSNGV